MDRVDDGARVPQADATGPRVAVGAARVARVDEPGRGTVFPHLVREHRSVLHRVPGKEGGAEAGAEGGFGLGDALLGARDLRARVWGVSDALLGACNP